jgi:Lysophospholipase L1 and related esterases
MIFINLLRTILLVLVAITVPAMADEKKIVMLGDSLTAGYGLPAPWALPVKLTEYLQNASQDVVIVNQGISGDTSGGGTARINDALAAKPDGLILALGANDALRGLPPTLMQENLSMIIEAHLAENIPVFLVGARAPSNWGPSYGDEFDQVFADLAQQHDLPFYPFLLEGVALDPKLNQDDMLHPNEQGVAEIVSRLGPQFLAFAQTL